MRHRQFVLAMATRHRRLDSWAERAVNIFAIFVLAVACLFANDLVHANERPRRVLMLHAYNYMFPSTTVAADSARKRWAERTPLKIEMDGEFLDLVRTSDPGHELRTIAYLREKYANIPLDLVMSMGGEAFPFVIKHREAFASKVPVVFTGVSPASYSLFRPPPDVTGILIELDLNKTLALAQSLQPNARRLIVIAGSSALDRRWQVTARRVIESQPRTFETTYLFELPYEALIAEVSRVPRDAMVLVLTVFADSGGKTFVPGELGTELANRSAAPVYSPYIHMLGKGILGGFNETYESIGKAAADMALEILEGKNPATIPPRLNPERTYRVDYNALQRWRLSEKNLPPDTIVMFKPPSIWEQHRGYVIAALAVMALLTAFIVALLIQSRRRQAAEAESALQKEQVAHLMRVSVLGELSGAIAHEINQPLTAISTNAHAALDMVPQNVPEFMELRETLQDIIQEDDRAGQVISRIRNLLKKGSKASESINLNDLVGATLGLLKSELINRRIDIKTELAAAIPPVVGDPVQIQQVLLNLLMNAMDAMARTPWADRRIRVSTRVAGEDVVEVCVLDRGDGIGDGNKSRAFEPFFTTKEHGLGLGLTICSTIAQAHGGTLTLENESEGGAVAVFTLPVQKTLVAAK